MQKAVILASIGLSLISLNAESTAEQADKEIGARADSAAQNSKGAALDSNNDGVRAGLHNNWERAIELHKRAVTLQPDNRTFRTNLSAAHLRYGALLYKRGKLLDAIKQFEGALAADQDNLPAKALLLECKKATVTH